MSRTSKSHWPSASSNNCGERTQSTCMPWGRSSSSTASRMCGWSSATNTRIGSCLLMFFLHWMLQVILRRVGYHAHLGIVDGDAGPLQCCPGGAIDVHICFFIRCLCACQGRFGDSQVMLRGQGVGTGLGAEFLFLLGDVEGMLRE